MHNITMLGTGLIGMFYTMSLHQYTPHRVGVVYSRRAERAEAFAKDWGIPRSTTSMESAISDPSTDIFPQFHHRQRAGKLRRCGRKKAVPKGKPMLGEQVVMKKRRERAADMLAQKEDVHHRLNVVLGLAKICVVLSVAPPAPARQSQSRL